LVLERAGYFTTHMRVNRFDALKGALQSDDRWLCVSAMFLIVKFQVNELYDELEKAKNATDALRRQAALFLSKRISAENKR